MTFTTRTRHGVVTQRCDSCTFTVTWRGNADNPPPSARNAIRGHECPEPRRGQR